MDNRNFSIAGPYVEYESTTTFKDVVEMEDAKKLIKEMLQMEITQKGQEACKTVLVHGPPGVGKTYFTRAIQGEMNRHLPIEKKCHAFRLTTSDLRINYLSEAYRNNSFLAAFFKDVAQNYTNPVVLLDDTEDLFQASLLARIRQDLLTYLTGSTNRVPLLMITNQPWRIYKEFRSAFGMKLFIDLPDIDTRYALLWGKCPSSLPSGLSSMDLSCLAVETLHYSCTDIITLAHHAQIMMLRKVEKVTHFLKVVLGDDPEGKSYYIPSTASDPEAEKITAFQIAEMSNVDIQLIPLTQEDVLESLGRMPWKGQISWMNLYTDFTWLHSLCAKKVPSLFCCCGYRITTALIQHAAPPPPHRARSRHSSFIREQLKLLPIPCTLHEKVLKAATKGQ